MSKTEGANKAPVIDVRFFGNFLVVIDGQVINESASRTKRPWSLLQYLLVYRHKTVSRQQLIEALWPHGDSEQPDKALKNLVYRVRTAFADKGVPFAQDIIRYSSSSYQLNNELDWRVDFEQFEVLCKKAMDSKRPDDDCIHDALAAVELYRGDFLSEHIYEDWVLPFNTHYRSMFFNCVERALSLLEGQQRYADIEYVSNQALLIDQFEEQLHYAYMNALMHQDKRSTAISHYNKMADMFYREMGVSPSDELRELYSELSKSMNSVETDLFSIKETLCEPEVNNDAFYCDYEVFRNLYRLEARGAERSGQAVFIGLLTLSDRDGGPPKNDILNKSMALLLDTVHSSLRRGDVVSRFSPAQYILMLPTLTIENAEMVIRRITDRFNRVSPFTSVRVDGKIQPLDPVMA